MILGVLNQESAEGKETTVLVDWKVEEGKGHEKINFDNFGNKSQG